MTKLLKTPDDHANAIARLSELMDCDPAPGTSEGDDLELLAHLIEDYEKKHFDIGLPDPLTAIRFRMEQAGLTRKDLVPLLGSQSRVSEVLSGKRPLTVQMIRRLHNGLGIPAEVLVQDSAPKAKKQESPPVKPSLKAVKEMCVRGYFEGVSNWKKAKTQWNDLLDQFFGAMPELAAAPTFNRQMLRAGASEDAGALLAWKMRALQRAGARKVEGKFDAEMVTPAFLRQLAGLSRLTNGPLLAAEMLEKYGIAVVVERHLPGTWLDGAALLLPNGTPVIGLTLRHDRLDNFWFCLFHELGHVMKHIVTGKASSFLDDLDERSEDKCEREADDFARDTLIPRKDWTKFFKAGVFDHVSVRREAKRLLIDGAILAGRLRAEKMDFQMLTSLIGNGRVRKQFESASSN